MEAMYANSGWYPGFVTKVETNPGLTINVQYHWKKLNRSEVKNLEHIRHCPDFEWCKRLQLPRLSVGDQVEARFKHSCGLKDWYAAVVDAVTQDTYTLKYAGVCTTTFALMNYTLMHDVHEYVMMTHNFECVCTSCKFRRWCGGEKGETRKHTNLGGEKDWLPWCPRRQCWCWQEQELLF